MSLPFPVVVSLYILFFLSYYQAHSIGISIFAYFTFHLAIWGTAKRVIPMHFNYCRPKALALFNVTHTPCVTMIFSVCSHFLNCFLPTLCGISSHPPSPSRSSSSTFLALRLSLYTFITLAFVGTHIISAWLYG